MLRGLSVWKVSATTACIQIITFEGEKWAM